MLQVQIQPLSELVLPDSQRQADEQRGDAEFQLLLDKLLHVPHKEQRREERERRRRALSFQESVRSHRALPATG